MKFLRVVSVLSIVAATSGTLSADDTPEEKKAVGHCEKTAADGKTSDLEAKDKADCKAKGGKWNKAKKGDHHGSGDGHKHE